MTEFFTRAAIYWIVFMSMRIIKCIMHDETWHNPKVKPVPTVYVPFLYALMSLIPFLRFIFAVVTAWHLFVPPKGSLKYEEMKKLYESEHDPLDKEQNKS